MVDERHDGNWLSQLRQRIAEAEKMYADTAKERDGVDARLRAADELRQALKTVLRHDDHDRQVEANLPVRARLALIAMENGGLVRTDKASQHLADIGLYPSKHDAARTIFTVVKRAKDFERVEPGVWRYTGLDPRDDPMEEPPPCDPRDGMVDPSRP